MGTLSFPGSDNSGSDSGDTDVVDQSSDTQTPQQDDDPADTEEPVVTPDPTPTVDLSALAGNLQEGFNANHIAWNSINWSLFAPSSFRAVPPYSISHDVNTINVFIPISASETPEYVQRVNALGEPAEQGDDPLTGEPWFDDAGIPLDENGISIYELDAYGNPKRIVDSGADLFLAIGGSDGGDHLRNRDYTFPDGNGQERKITGAFMGFSGDDVLYSQNTHNPMLMGGSGDDSYILENVLVSDGIFTQVVEHGGDDNDSVISYANDWTYALDIDGRHLVLVDSTQSELIMFWDYNVPDARIENFWFDFDGNGLNEHYTFDEFNTKIKNDPDFWLGSMAPEELGVSRLTLEDLSQAISEAVNLSNQIEDLRVADVDTALQVARLYQAAFDRTPDEEGLNYWIDRWEVDHHNVRNIAEDFYNSEEFRDTYGSLSNREYVTLLYQNVLDREPDQPGLDYWMQDIFNGTARSDVMMLFSDSLENKINTELQLSGLTQIAEGEWALL